MHYFTYFESPLGRLVATSDGEAITGLYTPENSHYRDAQQGVQDDGPFVELKRQLNEYFAGTRTKFELPLDAQGTAFQKLVWGELERVPYGRTVRYRDIAKALDKPNAHRAVGSANGKNRLCILVPCHRIVPANGGVGGYNGGLRAKQWLLAHEARKSE